MRPPRWLALLLAIMLLSGHAAGLQLVAWSGMLLSRVQTMPVAQALQTTFDGSAPCRICRAVDVLQTTQAPAVPKLDHPAPHLAPGIAVPLPQPAATCRIIAAPDAVRLMPVGSSDVPTPPPRGS
jgi:hypothetical protein